MAEHLDGRGFPAPDPDALEHSRRVEARIREAVRHAGGVMRFSEYMDLALYAPGLGYYSAGACKFGPSGDFVTAPEISPLFPYCLANACAEILADIDGGEIIEIGGGSGAMAAGVLDRLDTLGALPARYLMLEVSADLRQRQRSLLSQRSPVLAERVRWIDSIPFEIRGVVLANEVLDALPFERFRIEASGPVYLGVALGEGGFRVAPMPPDRALERHVRTISDAVGAPLSAGYESEWCPRLPAFVSAIARALHVGVVLFTDYGLPRGERYHPERRGGTLMCHYRHRAHGDPFMYPGLQDITAWVDFTSVAEAGTSDGLALEGFTSQAHFLIGSGLEEAVGRLELRDPRRRLEVASQIRTLTLPGEMGERFKVMALSRGWRGKLSGLTRQDLSGSL